MGICGYFDFLGIDIASLIDAISDVIIFELILNLMEQTH